jgi:hypothetical protein
MHRRQRLGATARRRRARALPAPLSDLATFGYGALGALGSLVFVAILPWGLGLMGGAELIVSFPRLVGVVVVVVATMALGGLVAFVVGDATSARHAVFYGLGWQGLIGGFIQGRRVEAAEAEPAAEHDG